MGKIDRMPPKFTLCAFARNLVERWIEIAGSQKVIAIPFDIDQMDAMLVKCLKRFDDRDLVGKLHFGCPDPDVEKIPQKKQSLNIVLPAAMQKIEKQFQLLIEAFQVGIGQNECVSVLHDVFGFSSSCRSFSDVPRNRCSLGG